MHALRTELRNQGAGKLADRFDWDKAGKFDPHIPAEQLLDELRRVSPIPPAPPDHEYVSPIEKAMPADIRFLTPRPQLAASTVAHWAALWLRFLTFLVGAAYHGDGVEVC